jgi:hypothetical protein
MRKHPLFKAILLFQVLAFPSLSTAKPFVTQSDFEKGGVGVVGFPSLEVLPGSTPAIAGVVVREIPITNQITYSASYTTPTAKFVEPNSFLITLYGYYPTAQWGKIKKLTFRFGSWSFSATPRYTVLGPDRDRSADAFKSNYFETLSVILPAQTAASIARNNGVLITPDNNLFYLPMSASKLAAFKQLVDSPGVIAKRQKAKSAPSPKPQSAESRKPRAKALAPGLPITEVFTDSTGATSLETSLVQISNNFRIQGMAVTESQGRKLNPPFTALLLLSYGMEPIWTNVNSVTLSYGAKKLRLTPNVHTNNQNPNGIYIEAMTVRVPYRDFVALARSGKFYVTVGDGSFAVNNWQATGFRDLARRIAR